MKNFRISEENFPDIKNIYETRKGQLNKNQVVEELFNKISSQTWSNTFAQNEKLNARIQKYIKASNMYGDTDEINSLGEGHWEAFVETNGNWVKEQFHPKTYSVWAERKFEDKYYYTVKGDRVARAMEGAQQLGGYLTQLYNSSEMARFLKWYDRIRFYLKQYVTTIEVEEVEGEDFNITAAKKITEILLKLQLPNTTNEKSKINMFGLNDIQLTLNIPFANSLSWEQAKFLNASSIQNLNKILEESVTLDLTEKVSGNDKESPELICVIDTPMSLYFGRQYGPMNDYQHFASDKYTNFYLHETYSAAVVNFMPTIKVVKKATTPPEGQRVTQK